MDHRILLSFTVLLVLLLQLQAHLVSPGHQRLAATGWLDRHGQQQLERRRLATDLAALTAVR